VPTLRIQRRLQRIKRFRDISVILAKYGFDEILGRAHLPVHLKAALRKPIGKVTTSPERLRQALEELGPTFIKFGQTLSTRSYLFPPEYSRELAKLQDKVKPFEFDKVCDVVTAELGKPLEEAFASFETEPFASASIAQVHRARLPGGEEVVVKVQRPGVRETLVQDIMILEDIARLLEEHVPESRRYDPSGMVREFKRTSKREVDFGIERANIEVFRRNFEGSEEVYVEETYGEYSTSRVLTIEFIDGIKISDTERLKEADVDASSVARVGARAVLKQVFDDGFFHADPHPGNIFVLRDGRIAPVDFGMVGRLTEDDKDALADLLIGFVKKNPDRLMRVMEKLDLIPANVDKREVVEDLMLIIDKYSMMSLGEVNMKELISEVMSFLTMYRIRMRTEFLLLGKALGVYEEVGRVLDPGFNMLEEAKPYVEKLVRRKYSISGLLGHRTSELGDVITQLSSIPGDLASLISVAKAGKLRIEFEHRGLEKLTSEFEKSSSRLSFSMLVAALIVASCLIMVFGREAVPYHRALGTGGFFFAAIVGLWLLIDTIRSGRV
jgi:ubiquinone biosynthesis protein